MVKVEAPIGAGGSATNLVAPETIADTGLSQDLIMQLVIKLLHFNADCTGAEIAHRLGLEFMVVEPILETLKRWRQCEALGDGAAGAASVRHRIMDAGRQAAEACLESSQYVGAAPVPLAQYLEYMATFRLAAKRNVTPAAVRQAVSHLVVSDRVVNQIGPAVTSGHSLFVYGPSGNGKTAIAQALHNLLEGAIAIPHAVEVGGHIIRLFNPFNHEPIPEADAHASTTGAKLDRRWILCKRPNVTVRGELTIQSLDLGYSPTTGIYTAPIQLLANGGLLVIDDFGRQACSPRELLNRWIVPLESRVDALTLQSGQKFDVPFDVLVVLATNIKPTELADEAVLRRIRYKVLAESPTVGEFRSIFKGCCAQRDVPYDDGLVEGLLDAFYRPRGLALRGCHPRDLIDQALSMAEYLGKPRQLTTELLEAVGEHYFMDDAEQASGDT
jgi:predicted ATPase with chaperone activity